MHITNIKNYPFTISESSLFEKYINGEIDFYALSEQKHFKKHISNPYFVPGNEEFILNDNKVYFNYDNEFNNCLGRYFNNIFVPELLYNLKCNEEWFNQQLKGNNVWVAQLGSVDYLTPDVIQYKLLPKKQERPYAHVLVNIGHDEKTLGELLKNSYKYHYDINKKCIAPSSNEFAAEKLIRPLKEEYIERILSVDALSIITKQILNVEFTIADDKRKILNRIIEINDPHELISFIKEYINY